MNIIIDGSNITVGGGLVHLQNLVLHSSPVTHKFDKIILYSSASVLEQIPNKSWCELREEKSFDKGIKYRLLWQLFKLGSIVNRENCILFTIGGLYIGEKCKYVAMLQNMQIFESKELEREGYSKEWLRLKILQKAQKKTFRNSSGIIFLSEYSFHYILKYYPDILYKKQTRIIPHGINTIYNKYKRNLKEISLLYVSTVKQYKHQWHLIEASSILVEQGYQIKLHLVGGGDVNALVRMNEAVSTFSKKGGFVFYHGELKHRDTLEFYRNADIFVFNSSCEACGISLLEAMAAGLPIACSDRGPMPEFLKDGGIYFNPESPRSIAASIKVLIDNDAIRNRLSSRAFEYASEYRWDKCSKQTFAFLESVY